MAAAPDASPVTPSGSAWPSEALAHHLRCRRAACPCRLPGAPLHCPACESLKPTLTIDDRDAERQRKAVRGPSSHLRCASGCTQEDIEDALRARGLLPTPAPHSP